MCVYIGDDKEELTRQIEVRVGSIKKLEQKYSNSSNESDKKEFVRVIDCELSSILAYSNRIQELENE